MTKLILGEFSENVIAENNYKLRLNLRKVKRRIILGKGEEEVGQARHLLSSPVRLAKQSLHTSRILLHLDQFL